MSTSVSQAASSGGEASGEYAFRRVPTSVTAASPSLTRVRRIIPPLSPGMAGVYLASFCFAAAALMLVLLSPLAIELLATAGAAPATMSAQPQFQSGLVQAIHQSLFADVAPPERLWLLLSLAAVLGAVMFASEFLLDRFAHRNSLEVAARLRRDLHAQTFRLGGSDVLGGPSSGAVRLFTESVETVRQALLDRFKALPRAVLLIVGFSVVALWLHVWLSLTAVLLACLYFLARNWFAETARPRRELLAHRTNTQMAALVEGVKHARLVSGYLLDDAPAESFSESMDRYGRQASKFHQFGALWRPLLSYYVLLSGLLLLGLVAANVMGAPSRVSLAESVLLFLALLCCARPLSRVLRLSAAAGRAETAAAKIFDYLRREPQVVERPDAVDVKPLAQKLELEGVDLLDDSGAALLSEVSLAIPAGCRVAVISTDSKQSLSLACLFPRFYDPHAGRVLYDGAEVSKATLKSLRSKIALVLQDGLLFTGSVSENIACGDPRFSELEIREAAKQAGAYDFIQRLPQGFATTIGEHGIALSAEESLLVGLSRALIRNPSVLIIEEPREKLDDETRMEQVMAAVAKGRTVILLANQLATLRGADHTFLLHEGRLHDQGPHASMLKNSELYRHLIYLRFNPFANSLA